MLIVSHYNIEKYSETGEYVDIFSFSVSCNCFL